MRKHPRWVAASDDADAKGPVSMLQRVWLLGALMLSALVSARASAQESASAQPYVVIVGIDEFQDKQIKPRRHAEADAQALYDLFRAPAHLGVPAANMKLLLGKPQQTGEKATRANILKALEWLEKNAPKESQVIFAYFGQGAPIGER